MKRHQTENSGQKFPVNASLKFQTHPSHCIAKYIVHIVTLSFLFLLSFVGVCFWCVFCGGGDGDGVGGGGRGLQYVTTV